MDNDARKARITTLAKWGIGLAGAALISPVVFLAVKGIVGLAIAAALGFTLVQLAPLFALKVANWRMKALVAEVEKNPIETMRNLYVEKADELASADRNIEDFETEIRNFDDQVETFKAQYPSEAANYEELSRKMREALADMKREQTAARRELAHFEQQIRKAEAIYKMSTAAAKVVKLSRSAEAQVFARIREQVAFDAVRTQLNRAFSSLNNALERRSDARAALPEAKPATVIDAATPRPVALVDRGR